jgi:hypothetical protein
MSNPQLEQVTAQAKAWAANHQLYPGWIIAPYQNRRTVWSYNQFWVKPALESLQHLPHDKRLELLDELNWRLETALVPLLPDVASAINGCLEDINPFPQALQLPAASVSLSPQNVGTFDWVGTSGSWLRLAFAIVRYYREEREHSKYEQWANRLQLVLTDDPEGKQRLCYERCLVALGSMDEAAVRTSLDAWPASPHDMIWELRRAAILAEIGRMQEAETLAESALNTLRAQIRPGGDDLPCLSREGWAMLLLQGLKHYRWWAREGSKPDYRGRWEQLTQYRCDPRIELEVLEAKLEQPVPQVRQPAVMLPGFQPGSYTQSCTF